MSQHARISVVTKRDVAKTDRIKVTRLRQTLVYALSCQVVFSGQKNDHATLLLSSLVIASEEVKPRPQMKCLQMLFIGCQE